MRFLRPALAIALSAGATFGALHAHEAQADAYPKPRMEVSLKPVSVNMRDFSFPSGFRVIFQEDHTQPVVSLVMKIDHGSQDDPEGLEGMAHLIEHLWFRSLHTGTDGKDLPKVWDLIQQMGASFNATTSNDRTDYLTSARSELLPNLLGLEALRLKDAVRKVTADDVLVEREVVRNELRLRYENGGAAGLGYLYDKLWPVGHPYHRMTIGSHGSLNNITLADIQKYVRDYYRASEATLVVGGDLSLDESSKYLEAFSIDMLAAKDDPEGKSLTLVAPTIRISGPPVEPPPTGTPIEVKGEVTNLQTFSAAVEKHTLVLGWPMPSAYTANDAVMYQALSQLRNAIVRELYPDWEYQQEDSPVSENALDCFPDAGRYGSAAVCFIEISEDDDPAKMTEKALNGLYTMWATDEMWAQFQDFQFSLSQQATLAYFLQSVDEVTDIFSGRAANVSDFVHFTGDPQYYSRQIEWNAKVNSDQVRAFAEKYFNRKRAVAVHLKPYEDGDITLDSSDSQYRGQSRDAAVLTIFKPEDINEKVINETIVVPDTKKIVEETLPNGMKVVVMPHGSGPIVRGIVAFGGGTGSVDMNHQQATFGLSNWTWPHYRAVDPLRVAGDDGTFISDLGFTVQGSAAAGNVEDLAYILRYRLDDTVVWTDGKIDWVKDAKKDIIKWMKKGIDAAPVIQRQRLFPGHPVGDWFDHKDWDAMGKMGSGDAQTVLSRILRPKNATLYLVGNITVDEARTAAKTYFGGWQGWGKEPAGWTAPRSMYPPPPAPPARQIILFNKDNASQTDVSYACQIAPVTPDTEWAANLMADVISDALWLALREQTGASYGAGAGTTGWEGGPAMMFQSVQVQNDQAAFAVKVFLEQGEKAKAMKLDDRILATRKFSNAQQYVIGQVSTNDMINRLFRVGSRGWGVNYFNEIGSRIAKVTQKDFPAILEPCVGHEVVTAVGPVSVIKANFDKLGMQVEVFDVDAYRKAYRAEMGLKEEKEDKKKDEKKGEKK